MVSFVTIKYDCIKTKESKTRVLVKLHVNLNLSRMKCGGRKVILNYLLSQLNSE